MRRLHVLAAGLRWPPEDFIRRRLQALAEHGLRVSVAAEAGRNEAAKHSIDGIELIRLPPEDEPLPRTLLALLRRADGLRLLRRTRDIPLLRQTLPLLAAGADIVHFEWESVAATFLPVLDAFAAPVLVSSHGGILVRPRVGDERMTRAYPELFRRAAAVHCVAEAVRQEALKYGLDPVKGRVIRTAVDTDFFTPAPEPPPDDGTVRIVGVGELNWMKGYDQALRAVAQLAAAGIPVSYEILGGDPAAETGKPSDRGRLLYLVHELGLGDRVRMLGEVTQAQVRDRLWHAHVLLQASLTEALPNTILEAMACGLPVVATDCGGVREAVTDGVEGLVCPRRAPGALAQALRSLRDDPERRAWMGAAGRARAVAEFGLAEQVARFVRLYEELSVARPPEPLA